jgi:branched-chain amino acid transport system substrate-binding protein
MHFNKIARVVMQGATVIVLVGALSLAACGSTGGGSKTVTIASDLPTSGTDGAVGLPTQNGVQLAVDQAKLPNGYTLKYVPKNDVSTTTGAHDPATGAANIRSLLSDSTVVAAVGPFNSSVAKAEIPVSNDSGLTLMSPTNTNPGLTLQQYAADNGIDFAQLHPAGKPDCYFRIPGNDVVQGTLLADIALKAQPPLKPAFTKVYEVDDNETYGVGLTNFFDKEFTSKGGTSLGRDSITSNQASALTSLAAKIKAAKPDFVFYGGVTSGGGATLKADLGPTVPFEGGDGIADDPAWIQGAGAASINTFGSVAAPDTSTFTTGTGATFVSAYKAKFGSDPLPYSAQAYDAAQIEIQAITAVINSGKAPTKANVCAQVAKTTYTGVTGTISFDANGDNSGVRVFSIYAILVPTGGAAPAWSFVQEAQG